LQNILGNFTGNGLKACLVVGDKRINRCVENKLSQQKEAIIMSKKILSALAVVFIIAAGNAFAGPPAFVKETFPEKEMSAMLKGLSAIQADNELDRKTKGLIAVAVAAQIPCQYCVYANTASLKKMGVTDAQIKEAIAMSGYIRLVSTILNGNNYDYDKFTREIDQRIGGS
jgi:AhpD family alkylhydroperoxidase